MWAWLNGKKTYILAAITALGQFVKLVKPEWGPAVDKMTEVIGGLFVLTVGHALVRSNTTIGSQS